MTEPALPATARPQAQPARRRTVIRDALAVGLATGTYGFSFGALSDAAGLSTAQTAALSALMFTGASQFAFVGAVAAGGAPLAGVLPAVLLGMRNSFYGFGLDRLLRLRGLRRLVGAHLVIDESTAMAVGQRRVEFASLAFWATGASVFVLWNLATLLGALSGDMITDPAAIGLDAVAPAAFVALVAPRIRTRPAWLVATATAVVALCLVPFQPAGVVVLAAAAVVMAVVTLMPRLAGVVTAGHGTSDGVDG
ncbi:AzlC family ABC transporter permease [Micromonospora sp. NPDC005298]|uniref:AzlC family ABC transporter permease n=1 Tax=Micromonospora sp. NPDC005298 TaxID=3156873 RepID=UPI0033B36826